MHHYKAKGGTVFNFNSDLSGEVRVLDGEHYEARIRGDDLLEFVDWWRREYGEEKAQPSFEELQHREIVGRYNAARNAFVRNAAIAMMVTNDRPPEYCWKRALELWEKKPTEF